MEIVQNSTGARSHCLNPVVAVAFCTGVPIGYIRLSQFANAVAELAHAIARWKKQEPTLIFSICGIILVVCCKPELPFVG